MDPQKKKKLIIIGAAGVAVVALIIIIAVSVGGGKSNDCKVGHYYEGKVCTECPLGYACDGKAK